MVAFEVKAYSRICYKLVESEERSRMVKYLVEQKVVFREVEEFARRQITKLKIKGTLPKFCEKRRREIIALSIKTKLKDEITLGNKLRKKKQFLKGRLEELVGRKTHTCRRQKREINTRVDEHRRIKNQE